MDKLLLVDDEADVLYSFRRIFTSPDIQLTTASSGEQALEVIPRIQPDLVIMDLRMGGMTGLETLRRIRELDSKLLVILMTAYGTTQAAIEAMKLGAYDYLLKPFDVPKLKELVARALKAARDMKQVVACGPLLESEDYESGIVGRSPEMQEVFKLIGQTAASDAPVLITGETGTGKELVARAIYHHSGRHERPFLAINCAAIPEPLLESELFGHEKGAFTGATSQRIGRFEQCHRGTLFLDEIGDMPLATQTKILRVLQAGTFERVGGNSPIQVDVRVIAATNKPLEEAVTRRLFREDLFYRLNVVRVRIPPLRERPGDIPLLVDFFLRKFARDAGARPKSISAAALERLSTGAWPGNVRELENVIRRALVVCKGDAVLPDDLPPEMADARNLAAGASLPPATAEPPTVALVTGASAPGTTGTGIHVAGEGQPEVPALAAQLFRLARQNRELKVLPAVERELIIEALKETRGNQVHAARLLGITRATLRKRIEKFGIRRELTIE